MTFEVESRLDVPVLQFALTEHIIELGDDMMAREACERVLTRGIALVRRNEDGFPLGLIDARLALRWLDEEFRLSERVSHLISVVTAAPHYPMRTILLDVLSDGVPHWYALLEQKCLVGVLPPSIVSDCLIHFLKGNQEGAGHYFEMFHNGERGQTLIDSVDPSGGAAQPPCFCCPDVYSGQKPHRVDGKMVSMPDAWGSYYCPYHKRTRINKDLTCTLC
jgi:hypothetical protein